MLSDKLPSEYVKGFDAGCSFIVHEIRFMQHKYGNQVPLSTLLEHLTEKSCADTKQEEVKK